MKMAILIFILVFASFGCVNNNAPAPVHSGPVVAPETTVETPQQNSSMTNSTFNSEQYIWDNWSIK